MEFNDSKTFRNLQKAYEGELKACARYQIFADKAQKGGYEQIGRIFEEASGNEKEHAEIWLRLLNNGQLPDTLSNLAEACDGESYEWKQMYQEFAKTAREEGYEDISRLFDGVGSIERHHDYRFGKLGENLIAGRQYCKQKESLWICMNCGYLCWGECAPEKCPVCKFPQGFYKLLCEDY